MLANNPKNSFTKSNGIYILLFAIIASYALQQSLSYHALYRDTPWKQENYADAGGYYSHLLMWFDKGYHSKNYPADISQKLGTGDASFAGDVINIKYTCGVAYLESPFYLINRLFSNINHYKADATSISNKQVVSYAAAFYLFLGSVFLFLFLSGHFNKLTSFLIIAITIFATNIIYYAAYHPGMSHIYSYFLFSMFLYAGSKFIEFRKNSWIILLAITASMIALIRPTDILFLPIVLFFQPVRQSIQPFLKPKFILIALAVGILVWIPQFYYWHKLSGHLIHYSYANEGFKYWNSPKLLIVLFGEENGLILYNPFFLLVLLATIYGIIKKNIYSFYYFFLMLSVIYISASWHAPEFGCGYGQRNFVEIFAAGVFPIGFMIMDLHSRKRKFSIATISFLAIFFMMFNLKIINRYDHCYFGKVHWKYKDFSYYLSFERLVLRQNFNVYPYPNKTPELDGNKILNINNEDEFSKLAETTKEKLPSMVKRAVISMKIKSSEPTVFMETSVRVQLNDSIYYNTSCAMLVNNLQPNKWREARGILYFHLPKDIPSNAVVNFFIWNREKYAFQVDNFKAYIR